MSNFGLNQFCVMILIICPYHITESVKLLDNGMSNITYQTHVDSKVSRSMHTNRKVPIVIAKKRKRRAFSPRFIALYNGTDNPNNEQKLMVDAFIKSSNGLFKSEMEVIDDKATGLECSVGASPSKLVLYKPHIDRSAKLEVDSSQDKVVHSGRMKRYLLPVKAGTIRPLDHVRDGHGDRRCDRGRNTIRRCLPKERLLRSRQSYLIGGPFANGFRVLPKFKRRLRSSNSGRQLTYNRRYLNKKFNRYKNIFKGSDSGEVEDNKSEKIFAFFEPDSDSNNPQSMVNEERGESRNKILRKRLEPEEECGNPKLRSRCTRPRPTVVIHSVNIGRTGRICFPSTHRCMRLKTCPCSVSYRKCPARTTCCLQPVTLCFEEQDTTTLSTLGRCQGVDTMTPTPIDEDQCMVTPEAIEPGKARKRRCSCECGCGCPQSLRRSHPERAMARSGCGCGCGCGCLHPVPSRCRTSKALT